MSGVFMRSETGQAGDEMGARSGWKSLVARMLLAGVIVVSPSAFGTALADSGRFYLGITGTPGMAWTPRIKRPWTIPARSI